jgi:hypothetical protein
MSATDGLGRGQPIVITKHRGGYCARIDGVAVVGRGDTPEAALAQVKARYDDLAQFADEAEIDPAVLFPSGGRRSPALGAVKQAAIVVVCFALMMVPLSYALSTGLERAVTNLDLAGGRLFWRKVEDAVIKAGDPHNAPTAEDQARTVAALHALVTRIQPYADALKPLFGTATPAAASATAPDAKPGQ